MLHLEIRNQGPPVPAEFSKTPARGGAHCAPFSGDLLRPAKGALAGDKAEAVLTSLQNKWPAEFRDGARCAFLQQQEGPRDAGGCPQGFHRWPLERRNAWFAGFNVGFHDRLRLSQTEARL
jgi:hypothetical protein